jgi:soluble lytic murein transglycosylase-like protein
MATTDIQNLIIQQANAQGVPSSIALAVAQIESAFNPSAVSPVGAQGLFQLMPGTAAQLGVTDPFDPQQNATGGIAYLNQLYKKYGDWSTALAAYNWGPGNVDSKPSIPSSVTNYVNSVLGLAGTSATTVSDTSVDSAGDLAPTDSGTINPLWIAGAAIAGGVLLVWALD